MEGEIILDLIVDNSSCRSPITVNGVSSHHRHALSDVAVATKRRRVESAGGAVERRERKTAGISRRHSPVVFRSCSRRNDNSIAQTDIVILLTPHRTHVAQGNPEQDLRPIYLGSGTTAWRAATDPQRPDARQRPRQPPALQAESPATRRQLAGARTARHRAVLPPATPRRAPIRRSRPQTLPTPTPVPPPGNQTQANPPTPPPLIRSRAPASAGADSAHAPVRRSGRRRVAVCRLPQGAATAGDDFLNAAFDHDCGVRPGGELHAPRRAECDVHAAARLGARRHHDYLFERRHRRVGVGIA